MTAQNSSSILAELVRTLESNPQTISTRTQDLIPQLKAALEELEAARSFDFREIGDHLYDGIYIADGQGKTLYVNQAYERMTGIKAEDIINRYVTDCEKAGLYRNAVTPEVLRLKRQVNSVGQSLKTNLKMLISGNPIFDEQGKIKKVVVVDRDITNLWDMQKQLEASQQQMQAAEAAKRKKNREIEHLRTTDLKNKNLIGRSPAMQEVLQKIQQVASSDVTVLITGETGTGKEVVANEIYLNSPRHEEPFIKVNCSAIPSNLLESELFGYEKGAFTGASPNGRFGLFELADKGTLLLDEIGDMPLELQAKLLRVLQQKEITRVGGSKPVKLNLRIIAATNCDLQELVKQGKFREDLYYRLNIFPIHIPSLRQRSEDIQLLTDHFLQVYNGKYGKSVTINPLGIQVLCHYPWPGNIRELQNIMERIIIIASSHCIVTAAQIESLLTVEPCSKKLMQTKLSLKELVAQFEKQTLETVLAQCGSTRKAAEILKVDQSTIVKKVKKLGIVYPS